MRLKIYYHIYGNPASEPIVSEHVNVRCSSKLWETVKSVLNLYEHPPMNLYDDVIPRSLYVIQVVSGIGFMIRNCLSIVLLAGLIRIVIRVKLRIIKQCN